MAASILHRISGGVLTVGGLAVLAWWLMALAGGADTYGQFAELAGHWAGKVVLIGLTWAFFQHLLTGIRHLAMDTGQGFELGVNKRSAVVTFAGAVVFTAALWAHFLGVFR
jgi:succinate dehydrogenase / fumarate reductase, cytochrome b subunit